MFIMISSWQRTNIQDTVPKRMADTYREAAVSITITTLTDVLAFYLSYGNPFGSVHSFCLYAGTAVLFCYHFLWSLSGSEWQKGGGEQTLVNLHEGPRRGPTRTV